MLGKSAGWGKLRKPHNVPLTLLGAGLLWAGWYAFNGGSALAAGNSAAIVMVTTFVATCAATLAWIAVEKVKDGHVTGVGAASGAITGLVAITPACGAVTPVGAIILGAIAGAICVYAVGLKERFGYDDSLDVVGVHLVGGVVGTILIGFLASESMPNAINGLFYGGGFDQLWRQAVAAGAVMIYSFVVAAIIAFAIKKTMGIRISPDEEEAGIDAAFHREASYELHTSLTKPRPARDHSSAPAGLVGTVFHIATRDSSQETGLPDDVHRPRRTGPAVRYEVHPRVVRRPAR